MAFNLLFKLKNTEHIWLINFSKVWLAYCVQQTSQKEILYLNCQKNLKISLEKCLQANSEKCVSRHSKWLKQLLKLKKHIYNI